MFLRGLFEDPSYRIKAKLGLFDDNGEGDQGGGAGGGGGEGGQPQIGEEGGELDQQRTGEEGAGDQGLGRRAPGGQGRHRADLIPKHRFDQVNRGFQAYRSFGSPAEIKQKLDRLKYLEANPQNRYTPEHVAEIQGDFDHLFPHMKGMQAFYENQKTNYVNYGSRQNERYVKALGWENNDVNKQMVEDAISGMIGRNPELQQRFFALDSTLFDEVFEIVKKVWVGNRSSNGNRVVPGLNAVGNKRVPKAPVSDTQKKLDEKLKDVKPSPLAERDILSHASDAAFDLISSREE